MGRSKIDMKDATTTRMGRAIRGVNRECLEGKHASGSRRE